MRKHSFVAFLATISILGLSANSSRADLIRVDLPQWQGTYENSDVSPRVSLENLTALYDNISDMALELTGVHTRGWSKMETTGVEYPIEGALEASLAGTWTDGFGMLLGHAKYYGSTAEEFVATIPFVSLIEIVGSPHSGLLPIDWKDFNSRYTGCDLTLSYEAYFIGEPEIAPKFTLTKAALVFNATPVPEPSCLCLFLGAIIGMCVFSRRFRTC